LGLGYPEVDVGKVPFTSLRSFSSAVLQPDTGSFSAAARLRGFVTVNCAPSTWRRQMENTGRRKCNIQNLQSASRSSVNPSHSGNVCLTVRVSWIGYALSLLPENRILAEILPS